MKVETQRKTCLQQHTVEIALTKAVIVKGRFIRPTYNKHGRVF